MGFDWVTKAKRNTVFYRKTSRKKGKPRFARITIREVLCEAYAQMPQTQDTQPICLAMPDLYMKLLGLEAVAQYADMAAFFLSRRCCSSGHLTTCLTTIDFSTISAIPSMFSPRM